LNFALIAPLGLRGIVLSTLITRIIICVIALAYLKRHVPQITFRPIIYRFAQTMVSLVIMVGIMYGLQQIFGAVLQRTYGLMWQIAALMLVTVAGAIAYMTTAWLTHHSDLLALIRIVDQTRYGSFLRRVGITA
jgi:peptidoglycan biosynthesis protein MviN/MurJ (putative lipid II flippase)